MGVSCFRDQGEPLGKRIKSPSNRKISRREKLFKHFCLNQDKITQEFGQRGVTCRGTSSAMWKSIVTFLLSFCLGRTMAYEVEPVTEPRTLGEGPHWDPQTQNLYFVDEFGSSIHRYNPAENRETSCKIDKSASVSIVIPIKGSQNKFAVTVGRSLTAVTWDGESATPEKIELITKVDEEPWNENNQFNDGKADPTGRLWVGTMGPISLDGVWTPEKGSLYSFKKNEKPKKHLENLSIANGLIWNKNETKMFYIDSPTRRIDVFDFDSDVGTISNRRLFFDVSPHIKSKDGGPDGMTIDSEDNLWFAVFGEGAVFNINGTTGDFIRKIDVPCKQPTSVAFGGKNLDELYVTTGSFALTEEDRKLYPKSGCTFRVKGLGVTGRPMASAVL